MLFVFCLRGSFRLLDIGDRILTFTLAELPYRVIRENKLRRVVTTTLYQVHPYIYLQHRPLDKS